MRRFSASQSVSTHVLLLLPLFLKVLHGQSNCANCEFKENTVNATEIMTVVDSGFTLTTNISDTMKTNSDIIEAGLTPGISDTFNLPFPDVIRNQYVAEITTSSVLLNWTNGQSYQSYYKVIWSNSSTVQSLENISAPANITGLSAATAYTFIVTAVGVENSTGGVAVNITLFTRPDVIVNLSTTKVTTSSVFLTWNPPVANISFYKVKWNYSNVTNNNTTNSPSITVLNLLPGVLYTFSVTAVAGDRKTEGSPVSLTQFTRPEVITNLSVSQITCTSLSLTWSPLLENVFYRVVWSNISVNKSLTTNETSSIITNLAAGTQYAVSIVAVAADNATEGAPFVKIQYTNPAKPHITSVNPGNDSLNIYWSLPQGTAERYEVDITSYNCSMTLNQTGSENYIVFSGLSAGVLYNVTVTSIVGLLRNTSDTVQFATKPNPPGAIHVQQKTNDSIHLSWDNPLMNKCVNVYFSITYTSSQNANQTVAFQSNILLRSLNSGTQYNICVVAVVSEELSSSAVCQSEYTLPNPVQNPVTSLVSNNSVRLEWGTPVGLQPYYTYLVQITNSSWKMENKTDKNYIEILNLAAGSRYNVTVQTVASNSTESVPRFTTCQTKPNPVGNFTAVAVNTTTINLMWTSQDYDQGSNLYLVSGVQNITTTNKGFSFSNLIPGTNYSFTIITVVNGVLSDPSTASSFTKPEKATNIMAVGTNSSLTVTWNRPNGYFAFLRISIYNNRSGTTNQTVQSGNSFVFSNLSSGQIFYITITTYSGPFQVDSDVVQNATYPNPPSNMKMEQQTTSSVNISWSRPADVDVSQYSFIVYSQSRQITSSNNWFVLENRESATGYNISVVTVGPMGYQSTPETLQVFTLPRTISHLQASEITTSNVTLVWQSPDTRGIYQYLITVANTSLVTPNTSANIRGLQSGNNYTFRVCVLGPDGSNTSAVDIVLFTRPYPIGSVYSYTLSTTAMYLNWTRPKEYRQDYSYRVEISVCTPDVENQSVATEAAQVTGLTPGTKCTFRIYSQAANGIEGTPVSILQYTMPETVMPYISNGGTNHSIAVQWSSPRGNVEKYMVSLTSHQGEAVSQQLNSTARSFLFTNLTAGRIYTATVETVSGPFTEKSNPVSNATYPNKPGPITLKQRTIDTISLQWTDAPGMDKGSFFYMVNYWSLKSMNTINVTVNTVDLWSLDSGTTYNISVVTVGPMQLMSEKMEEIWVTTKPEEVQSLKIYSTSAEEVVLVWEKPLKFKTGYSYGVVTSDENNVVSTTVFSENYTAASLNPGSLYNFSVSTLAWDKTESSNVVVLTCTDAAPVLDLSCHGPDLTDAMLTLTWNIPKGLNKGFNIKVVNNERSGFKCGPTCNLNITGLSYSMNYDVSLQTLGCGKNSSLQTMSCKTGITVPPIPDAKKYVKVIKTEFDKFTLELDSSLFSDINGPIVNYGILVTSNDKNVLAESPSSLKKYLNKTYNDWKNEQISTYLAVVEDNKDTSQTSGNSEIVIGSSATWLNYVNGPLKARGVYSFAVVMFTRLQDKNGLIDISGSYVSISSFYENAVSLPENPVVIASAAGGVSCLLIPLIVAIAVIFFKRRSGPETSDIPIHSLRAKVSVPIKVENFEDYFKKQRANSNCGFAEEFENLKTVGVAQEKNSALALENKGKNRYNNVLPYDCSRVKLSVQGSLFDDYINASYMPGYNSRKEFIAAQGPLPSTVNEFWRMIWEKNVRTLVMLTRCNEQGRVKCEEYWPSGTKHFNNITVIMMSEIILEDWTIRDFNVKNVKTAETRNLRQFHFTAWPDHGVPETTELLINFRHLVREHMDEFSKNSPTVVHCSAGVGRTGTLIAIDRLIFQIEREGVVDVFGTIHDLRMHRPLMVQTEDQYVFLNQCAMDIIKARTGTNVDLIYQNMTALTIYENFEPSQKSKLVYHQA